MTFRAKTQQGHFVFLLGLLALTPSANGYGIGDVFLRIGLVLSLFVAYHINFSFTINEEHLIYQIFISKLLIYQKEIEPNQIKQIKFIGSGWSKKGAIIQRKNGWSIRVIRFEPEGVVHI